MNKEDLIYLSRQYANMFGLPVRLYQDDQKLYFYSITLNADPIALCEKNVLMADKEVGYYIFENFYYYGFVKHEDFKVVIGPVTELKITENELKMLGKRIDLEGDDIKAFILQMNSLVGIHLATLIQIVILLSANLNNTRYEMYDLRINEDELTSISSNMLEEELQGINVSEYRINSTRSYILINEIVKKVGEGDVEGLSDMLKSIPAIKGVNTSSNLLRTHKNFFIRLAVMASKTAVDAGLDIEETMATEELYIQKCESLIDMDRIKNLEYHMLVDFADRVRKLRRYNDKESKLINDIAVYIANHISESIKISDLADFLGKNRSVLTTEFKKITGLNLSDYIKIKKIDKAEELLKYTNKNFASISSYLGFCTQSHFCRVFKEIKGITPAEFRKKSI